MHCASTSVMNWLCYTTVWLYGTPHVVYNLLSNNDTVWHSLTTQTIYYSLCWAGYHPNRRKMSLVHKTNYPTVACKVQHYQYIQRLPLCCHCVTTHWSVGSHDHPTTNQYIQRLPLCCYCVTTHWSVGSHDRPHYQTTLTPNMYCTCVISSGSVAEVMVNYINGCHNQLQKQMLIFSNHCCWNSNSTSHVNNDVCKLV